MNVWWNARGVADKFLGLTPGNLPVLVGAFSGRFERNSHQVLWNIPSSVEIVGYGEDDLPRVGREGSICESIWANSGREDIS